MGIASDLISAGTQMINEYGEEILYRQYGEPEVLSGGAGVTRDEDDYTVMGFFDEYKRMSVDGSLIQQGDSKVYIITEDFKPKQNDHIFIGGTEDGERLSVVDVLTYRAQARNVMFELQVRG